jgi:hypothetical protein
MDIEFHSTDSTRIGYGSGKSGEGQFVSGDVVQVAHCIHAQRRPPGVLQLIASATPTTVGVVIQTRYNAAVIDDQSQVLSYRRHLWIEHSIPAPLINRDSTLVIDHQGSGTQAQRYDRFTIRVVAALGVDHLETRVERGHQPGPETGRDSTGVTAIGVPRLSRPGDQFGTQALLIESSDRGDYLGVRGIGVNHGPQHR